MTYSSVVHATVDPTPRRRSGVERLFMRLAQWRYIKKRKHMNFKEFELRHSRAIFKEAATEVYYEMMQTMFDDEKEKLVDCAIVRQFCGDQLP